MENYDHCTCTMREEGLARGYKTFSILNSVEHGILNAHKYKPIKQWLFLGSGRSDFRLNDGTILNLT